MTTLARRIGVFGGAFDPPHLGHVALVQAALAQLQLDEIRIVPTGVAWHKSRSLTAAEHRLAMALLAFGAVPRCVVDARELQRSGPSYTVDTLTELHREQPQALLFLLLGADQAATLPSWHRLDDIAQLASLYVAPRAAEQGGAETTTQGHAPVPLFPLNMAPCDVASTHIRECLQQGLPVFGLVPDPVAGYIDQHCLYQNH